MRWQPKPPPAEMPIWGWFLAPIWAPAIGLLAAVLGVKWCKRWLMGPTKEWRPWFAWFPITIETWPEHEDWPVKERIWLEWVERCSGHLLGDAQHRVRLASLPTTQKD